MDEKKVKKIKISASGPFVFSWKYSENEIIQPLTEAIVLYKTVEDLPILPSLFAKINEEIIRRSIFGTAALEGNPLSEEKVAQILTAPDKVKNIKKAEQEIINLKKAYEEIIKLQTENVPFLLNEDSILLFHKVITEYIDYERNIPGVYRNCRIKVGNREHGGVYTPPKSRNDIQKLMTFFVDFINSEDVINLGPIIRATTAHYYLGKIHPFGDGNGRTARVLEALLLKTSGIKFVPLLLSNYYYNNIDDYYWAFSLTTKHKEYEITPFLQFVLKGFIEVLKEIKDKITYAIRKVCLRDYFLQLNEDKVITKRQYDLITMLVDIPFEFTIDTLFFQTPFSILYRDVSTRTAWRDIRKLLDMNLVIMVQKGKYKFNWYCL